MDPEFHLTTACLLVISGTQLKTPLRLESISAVVVQTFPLVPLLRIIFEVALREGPLPACFQEGRDTAKREKSM